MIVGKTIRLVVREETTIYRIHLMEEFKKQNAIFGNLLNLNFKS